MTQPLETVLGQEMLFPLTMQAQRTIMAMTWIPRPWNFSFYSQLYLHISPVWKLFGVSTMDHKSHFLNVFYCSQVLKRKRLGKWDSFIHLQLSQVQKEKSLISISKKRCFSILALKSFLVVEYYNPFTKVPSLFHLELWMEIFNKNTLLRRSLRVSLSLPPPLPPPNSFTHTQSPVFLARKLN